MKSFKIGFRTIMYLAIFVVILLLLPQPVDWGVHYGRSSENPYGGALIYESLDQIFTKGIEVNEEPFYLSLDSLSEEGQNLIVITNYFNLDSLDKNKLLDFVDKGNDAFIACQYFDQEFLKTFGLKTNTVFNGTLTNPDYNYSNFGNSQIKKDTSYSFKGLHYEYFFEKDTASNLSDRVSAVSFNEDLSKPNCVKASHGKGSFYLHTGPLAFTNYHLLKPDNETYIAHVFSNMPNRNTIWDEYYKPQRVDKAKGIMHVVVSKPPLKWAYWIGFTSLLLYIIFMAKRTQRIIPVVEPFANDSVKFIKTIGGLYFKQSNHTEIANKKIQIFKEHIARTYYIRDIENNDKYIQLLAQKSGNDEALVRKIFQLIDRVQVEETVSEGLLRILNKNINIFYKR